MDKSLTRPIQKTEGRHKLPQWEPNGSITTDPIDSARIIRRHHERCYPNYSDSVKEISSFSSYSLGCPKECPYS